MCATLHEIGAPSEYRSTPEEDGAGLFLPLADTRFTRLLRWTCAYGANGPRISHGMPTCWQERVVHITWPRHTRNLTGASGTREPHEVGIFLARPPWVSCREVLHKVRSGANL